MNTKNINIWVIIVGLLLSVSVCAAQSKKRRPRLEDILKNPPKSKNNKPKPTPETKPAPQENSGKDQAGKVVVPGDSKIENPQGKTDSKTSDKDQNNQEPKNDESRNNSDSENKQGNTSDNSKNAPRYQSPDAEAVGKIIKQRPKVPVSRSKNAQPKTNDKLKKDRTIIAKRIGTIAKPKDSIWWVITFEKDKKGATERPRRIMPSKLLEAIEVILKDRPNAKFEVIGENYNDGSENYILFRRVVEIMPGNKPASAIKNGQDLESVLDKNDNDGASSSDSDEKKSEDKTEKKETDTKKSVPSSSDIAGELLKNTPGKTVVAKPKEKRTEAENRKSVAPTEGTSETKATVQIYSRIVRIVKSKDSDLYEIRFISDNSLRDPPMKILPNTRLKRALDLMKKAGQDECKFIVSGEITVYKKQRFILLRSVIKKRELS